MTHARSCVSYARDLSVIGLVIVYRINVWSSLMRDHVVVSEMLVKI